MGVVLSKSGWGDHLSAPPYASPMNMSIMLSKIIIELKVPDGLMVSVHDHQGEGCGFESVLDISLSFFLSTIEQVELHQVKTMLYQPCSAREISWMHTPSITWVIVTDTQAYYYIDNLE